jgi:methylthioribose-1-phosphate isomerase
MVLEAIRYTHTPNQNPGLTILDQLQLPHSTHYDAITSAEDGWNAIKSMRTRGAPAIAIVAALSLAVELGSTTTIQQGDAEGAASHIKERLQYLVTSRPTAVNLEDAARKLSKTVEEAAKSSGATGQTVVDAYISSAEQMLQDDVSDNKAIGKYGAEWILANCPGAKDRKVNIVTICNTGQVLSLDCHAVTYKNRSLATAGYGTALGVIRALHETGKLEHAYFLETRPYNQGSRLTAYEMKHDKIPATLITDSMAASLMKSTPIDAAVVGADRVTANGDTANKIGTYSLAVLSKHHGVKFLVAAPRTSIDLAKKSGNEITIEHRPQKELTMVTGPSVRDGVLSSEVHTVSLAPEGINVWNPAFDVTPAALIDGVITEVGVVEKKTDGADLDMATVFNS